ncbi:MAG TPA: hypothetical protein VFJ79_07170 [Acidimicrobiales bacterium]|nr:hypothetical protein [Acidimicrobiales bacterium]
MPEISFPQIDVNKAAADLNQALKEGAYVAVGLGVLGFQRAQVRRVELTKQLNDLAKSLEAQIGQTYPQSIQELGSQVEGYAKLARSQAETAREELNKQVAELNKQIAEQLSAATQVVGEQLASAREQFGELAKTVRSYAGLS